MIIIRQLHFLFSPLALAKAVVDKPSSKGLILLSMIGVIVFLMTLVPYFFLNMMAGLAFASLVEMILGSRPFSVAPGLIVIIWLIFCYASLFLFLLYLRQELIRRHYPYVTRNIALTLIPACLRGTILAVLSFYFYIGAIGLMEFIPITASELLGGLWISCFPPIISIVITWYSLISIKRALIPQANKP